MCVNIYIWDFLQNFMKLHMRNCNTTRVKDIKLIVSPNCWLLVYNVLLLYTMNILADLLDLLHLALVELWLARGGQLFDQLRQSLPVRHLHGSSTQHLPPPPPAAAKHRDIDVNSHRRLRNNIGCVYFMSPVSLFTCWSFTCQLAARMLSNVNTSSLWNRKHTHLLTSEKIIQLFASSPRSQSLLVENIKQDISGAFSPLHVLPRMRRTRHFQRMKS